MNCHLISDDIKNDIGKIYLYEWTFYYSHYFLNASVA